MAVVKVKGMTRRDLLRMLTVGGLGLIPLRYFGFRTKAYAMGCIPSLKETKQDVINQQWESNPILPIPIEGCYTGTNIQSVVLLVKSNFASKYGISPTFHAVGRGKSGASNNKFPMDICKFLIGDGIIPMIRYIISPFAGYKSITKGKYDDDICQFAQGVAKFEHPIVFVPFQLPNETTNRHYEWAASPPDRYKEAWVRIHGLFENEGANKNALWATKLKMGRWANFSYPDPFQYCPPDQYVDIIGWACNNLCKPEIGLYSQPFEWLFDYYYRHAAVKYSTKPQMLWELSCAKGSNQAKWFDDAFNAIRTKYFRVKGVMLDEVFFRGLGISYDPTPTDDCLKVIRRHFSTPYFIGSKW